MKKSKQLKVSLLEYAEHHNPVLNRRGHKMTWGYLYKLIKHDREGTGTRQLWFKYIVEGEKERIWIILKS